MSRLLLRGRPCGSRDGLLSRLRPDCASRLSMLVVRAATCFASFLLCSSSLAPSPGLLLAWRLPLLAHSLRECGPPAPRLCPADPLCGLPVLLASGLAVYLTRASGLGCRARFSRPMSSDDAGTGTASYIAKLLVLQQLLCALLLRGCKLLNQRSPESPVLVFGWRGGNHVLNFKHVFRVL